MDRFNFVKTLPMRDQTALDPELCNSAHSLDIFLLDQKIHRIYQRIFLIIPFPIKLSNQKMILH